MNREIKFRIYKAGEGMIYNGITCYASFDDNGTVNHLGEIMQYTGLKDKNGKEIFEGDIVKLFSDIGIVEYGEQDISHDWQGIGFYTRESDGSQLNIFGGNGIEVIGNIYENKDLIPTS